jgi:protein-disulfide isomerase
VVNRASGKGKAKGAGGGSGGGKRGFYLLLAALLIAGIGTISYLAARPKQTVSQVDSTIVPVPNQGHVTGSDSALVEIVEFADFECPGCGQFANITEPDVRARLVNSGQVRFRLMHFPLSMHPNAWPAHLAAWCAGEQGKFWEMHDLIFQNQDRWNTQTTRRPERVLGDLAKRVGVNENQYQSCVDSRKYHPQIQANVQEGIRLGVGSTPTFIIGGKRIADVLSYDELKRYVDEALTQARATKK